MSDHVILIPYQELREDDLREGVRVRVEWNPYDSKPVAVGNIEKVREWTDLGERDLLIELTDETSGFRRTASLKDQWIDVIMPIDAD